MKQLVVFLFLVFGCYVHYNSADDNDQVPVEKYKNHAELKRMARVAFRLVGRTVNSKDPHYGTCANPTFLDSVKFPGIKHLIALDLMHRNIISGPSNDRDQPCFDLISPLEFKTSVEKTVATQAFPESPYLAYYIYSTNQDFDKSRFETLFDLSHPIYCGSGDSNRPIVHFYYAKALLEGEMNYETATSIAIRIASEYLETGRSEFVVAIVEDSETLAKAQFVEYSSIEAYCGLTVNSYRGELGSTNSKVHADLRDLFLHPAIYHYVASNKLEKLAHNFNDLTFKIDLSKIPVFPHLKCGEPGDEPVRLEGVKNYFDIQVDATNKWYCFIPLHRLDFTGISRDDRTKIVTIFTDLMGPMFASLPAHNDLIETHLDPTFKAIESPSNDAQQSDTLKAIIEKLYKAMFAFEVAFVAQHRSYERTIQKQRRSLLALFEHNMNEFLYGDVATVSFQPDPIAAARQMPTDFMEKMVQQKNCWFDDPDGVDDFVAEDKDELDDEDFEAYLANLEEEDDDDE